MRVLFFGFAICAVLWSMIPTGWLYADLKEDIGFTRLYDELAGGIPTGDGVSVTQVEAPSDGHWMPDVSIAQFPGKAIADKTGGDTGSSSHATGVGKLFYGTVSSQTPNITAIDIYSASSWLGTESLLTGTTSGGNPLQPMYYINTSYIYDRVLSAPSRVANHSWVGTSGSAEDILRRLDFVIAADEFIQVVGTSNGSVPQALLADAFNAIAVGCSDGEHPRGTSDVDAVYTKGRICPLLVLPLDYTSSSAPVVASAAALLVQTGRETDLKNDPEQTFTTNRSGETIFNAERSETIKAALLAGAGRMTYNTSAEDQITDYRQDPANRSANGLDIRFGAGQLNTYNSYHIIAAGEQNSAEDEPAGNGDIGQYGFDVDPFFGGLSGSNEVANYHFTASPDDRRLYVSLVWHIKIDGGTWYDFDATTTLYNLDVCLYDTTAGSGDRLVAASTDSGSNTENLWTAIVPGRSYRMEVAAGDGHSDFLWDYAIAWRMGTPPDSDSDGIEDEWEVQYGLDYTSADDASIDVDSDGLGALLEYQHGTDLNNSDTDGDGISDGLEVTSSTDPLDAADYPRSVNAFSPAALVSTLLLLIAIPLLRRENN